MFHKVTTMTKTSSAFIALALLAFQISMAAIQHDWGPHVGLTDMPLLLPPYYSTAAEERLSGKARFEILFEEGKVKDVELLWKNFKSDANASTHQSVESILIMRTKRLLRDWRILDGGSFPLILTIHYIPDDSLEENQTIYNVRYNERGAIRELVITGSPRRTILDGR